MSESINLLDQNILPLLHTYLRLNYSLPTLPILVDEEARPSLVSNTVAKQVLG